MTFDTASRNVLSDFLQTAVVIDDAAYHLGKHEKVVTAVKTPTRRGTTVAKTAEAPARTQSAHSLDTQLLVSTFASRGLVCAVIAPDKEQSIVERLGSVAERCDIVVVDWQMFEDNGKRTRALINELCKRSGGDRLRLLCVYSGEIDLGSISDKLTRDIAGLALHNDDKFLLRKEHLIVTIVGKSVVPEDQIADTLLDRFSVFTKGLLSNAVLAALTGIRRNVHRIVKKFDSGLDPAYISHRIMSIPVDSVENEILSLVCSELESVVYQSSAKSHINCESIDRWIESDAGTKIKYDPLPGPIQKRPELLKQLITIGADATHAGVSDNYKHACNIVKKLPFIKNSELTKLLGCNDPKSTDRCFAALSTVETRYEDYIPQLTLGTIVHDGEQYLLCLMPRCDSARVPVEGRNFLFIRLKNDPSEIDLIIQDGDESVDLGISRHPYDTIIYRFAPDASQRPIMAKKKKETWVFYRREGQKRVKPVRWVADLKPQIAQAFANEYASRVCRVGVAKSQWLHKLGRK